MIFPPLCIAAGEPNASSALYVILAGFVCTVLGWWLRGWYAGQRQADSTSAAPHPSQEDDKALQEERGRLAAQIATMESALANAESARSEALRELEALRPKVVSHDELHERSRLLETEHRKALDDLTTAQSDLKASRLAEEEARARAGAVEMVPAVDPSRLEELERQLQEAQSRETAAREAEAKALEDTLAGTELNTRLQLELKELRDAVEAAREATASEKHRADELASDLDAARARVAAIESDPSMPKPTEMEGMEPPPPPEREALAKALEENRKADELAAAMRRELEDARTDAQSATAAAAAEQTRAAELSRELEEVRTRLTLSETPPPAPSPDNSREQLDETLQAAETARTELKAAQDEIRKLKAELSAPKPRPILTSPRPDGGGGANIRQS